MLVSDDDDEDAKENLRPRGRSNSSSRHSTRIQSNPFPVASFTEVHQVFRKSELLFNTCAKTHMHTQRTHKHAHTCLPAT